MNIKKIFRGISRYKNWLSVMSCMLMHKKPTSVILRSGIRIASSEKSDIIGMISEIFFSKRYNPAGFEIIEGDIVVDVGANIGVFSVYAATSKASKVISIEPEKENAEFVKKNMKINGFAKNHILLRAALFDISGTASLITSDCNEGHIVKAFDEEGEVIQTIDPNDLFATLNIERINFLKIDCEGAEGRIFSAKNREWLNKIDKICMEYHDHVSILQHNEIETILINSGFQTIVKRDSLSSPFGFIYAKR